MTDTHIHRNSGGNVDLTPETMLEWRTSLLSLHLQIGSVSCVLVFTWMCCVSPTMMSVAIWHHDHPSGTMMPSKLIPPTDLSSSPLVIHSTSHQNHHLATPQKTLSLVGLKLNSSSPCPWVPLLTPGGPHINQITNSPTNPQAKSCLPLSTHPFPSPSTDIMANHSPVHSCFSYHFHSHFPLDL